MNATSETPPVLTTGSVLQSVFPPASPARECAIELSVHAIPQHGEPRWIVLGDVRRALQVLRSWRPWNLSSRIRWRGVLAAASTGMLAHLPGVTKSRAVVDLVYWRQCDLAKTIDTAEAQHDGMVIHVGSRSHTRKAIMFFPEGRRTRFAAKVPLVDGAGKAILNEATVLHALEGNEFLPRTLFVDSKHGIAAQSWLEGAPVARGLSSAHLDLLGRLVRPGRAVRVCDFEPDVAAEVDRVRGPFNPEVLRAALTLLSYDESLPCFVEHRDFAPWNLKRLDTNRLGLLDWEWSVLDGLPWQDLCRFFYTDDAHFDGRGNVWKLMSENKLLREHCEQFAIPQRALPALTMHYLLRVFAMDWLSGNDSLARHSYRQMERLLEIGRNLHSS